MKPLKLSFALIVLGPALFLNSASHAENEKTSHNPSPSNSILSHDNKPKTEQEQDQAIADQRCSQNSPISVQIAPSQKTQEEAAEAKKEKERKAASERRTEITTWIVAVATAIQAIALFFTIRVMSRTARQQLRAYLHITKATISLHDRPEAIVDVINSGQTPAYNWYVERGMFFGGPGLPDDDCTPPNTAKPTLGNGALGPSVEGRFLSHAAKAPTKEQLAAIVAGNMHVFIHGTIHYRDTFGATHRTHFNLRTGKLVQLCGDLIICDEGNDAD
jgi:hypothetical protein